jgi:hypothetical protein
MRVLFAIIILFSFACGAQTKKEMTISYGEKIQLGEIEASTKFIMANGNTKSVLKGNSINSYVFAIPGTYTIQIEEKKAHDTNSCNHNHLPEVLTVHVSRIKMNFKGEGLTFSQPIQKNVETNGIILSIPVTIDTYDGQPVALNYKPINSAGIGTSIIGHLKNDMTLYPVGTHVLNYSLSGKVTQNAHLMFDFIDGNNAIQSVSLLTPIQN